MLNKNRMTLLLGTGIAVLTAGFSLGARPASAFPTSRPVSAFYDQNGHHEQNRRQQDRQWNDNNRRQDKDDKHRDRDDRHQDRDDQRGHPYFYRGNPPRDRGEQRWDGSNNRDRDRHQDRDDHHR